MCNLCSACCAFFKQSSAVTVTLKACANLQWLSMKHLVQFNPNLAAENSLIRHIT